jgi:hypothetical protein
MPSSLECGRRTRRAGQSGANSFLVRDLLRHKNLSMTGRSDELVRTLSDQVGERIAAGLAGREGGEVVARRPTTSCGLVATLPHLDFLFTWTAGHC